MESIKEESCFITLHASLQRKEKNRNKNNEFIGKKLDQYNKKEPPKYYPPHIFFFKKYYLDWTSMRLTQPFKIKNTKAFFFQMNSIVLKCCPFSFHFTSWCIFMMKGFFPSFPHCGDNMMKFCSYPQEFTHSFIKITFIAGHCESNWDATQPYGGIWVP